MIIGKRKDISFIDILSLIKCPEKYHWKIVWIYAFYYPSNLVYLEDKINSSKGYDIKLEDLKRLIESVGQLIELILIGDKEIIEDYSIEKEEEIKYKPQNRQYKNIQIEKSLKTLINKGIEAKKPQNRNKTKCTITTI